MYNYTYNIFLGFIMQTVKLIKWGNSVGIRLPVAILKETHLMVGEELQITINKKGELIFIPVTDPQAGWTEAFNTIADADEGKLLADVQNEFDGDEWKW